MIKQFLDTVEDLAYKAMFKYIDSQLDIHDEQFKKMKKMHQEDIKALQKDIDNLKDYQKAFKDTEKVVEAYIALSKVVKKATVTAIVTGVIGFILYRLGMGGG